MWELCPLNSPHLPSSFDFDVRAFSFIGVVFSGDIKKGLAFRCCFVLSFLSSFSSGMTTRYDSLRHNDTTT